MCVSCVSVDHVSSGGKVSDEFVSSSCFCVVSSVVSVKSAGESGAGADAVGSSECGSGGSFVLVGAGSAAFGSSEGPSESGGS